MSAQHAIAAALASARPQAVGALLRHFRSLDTAEDAYQEACVRALRSWPVKGMPRDPVAWLIFAGRNAAIDQLRRTSRQEPLPPEEILSDLDDAEAGIVEAMDKADYRDDILRLLFICCHPDLAASQQIALALKTVSGLSVRQIAKAFLVGEAAMEQRITRAKHRIAAAGVPFEAPDAAERGRRLAAVSAMIYLLFNEGYTSIAEEAPQRAPLCEEAIRLGRLLLRLYPSDPEIGGLTALMLLNHARRAARFDATGAIVLLEDQDRSLWDRKAIAEGLSMTGDAFHTRRPGPYLLQAAISAEHARAATAADTDWKRIDLIYAVLEEVAPSPIVTLNRAVAVAKVRGSAEALAMVEPLAGRLASYFHFHGLRGWLLADLGRKEEARAAFRQAEKLAASPAEADHIRTRIAELDGKTGKTA